MKSAGLNQIALSRATGLRQSAISSYCNSGGLPSAEALYRIAKNLNVSMEWLLMGDEEKNQISESLAALKEENIRLRAALQLAIGSMEGAVTTLKSSL